MSSLYLGLSILGAVREANQGLAHRIDPCVLCAYDVDCEDIADLRTARSRNALAVSMLDMQCPWMLHLADGTEPPSWTIARRLMADGFSGVLVPSFAPGASSSDGNLVLWRWSDRPPHQVRVHDPAGRLPRSPASWE